MWLLVKVLLIIPWIFSRLIQDVFRLKLLGIVPETYMEFMSRIKIQVEELIAE